jgi:hypothetical protein
MGLGGQGLMKQKASLAGCQPALYKHNNRAF